MSRILDITVELFSAVSPARLPAFASALRSAIEGSGIWKEAPPPTPITIPWHIVEVNSAAEVEAAKKAGFGKVLIHINKTNPHKSFRLSPVGRHHWKLEFCSYNVKPIAQVEQDVLDVLSDVSVRDARHNVKLCEVESIDISSRPLPRGKLPRSSEITLDVEKFRRHEKSYKKKHRQILHRESERRTREADNLHQQLLQQRAFKPK